MLEITAERGLARERERGRGGSSLPVDRLIPTHGSRTILATIDGQTNKKPSPKDRTWIGREGIKGIDGRNVRQGDSDPEDKRAEEAEEREREGQSHCIEGRPPLLRFDSDDS